MDCKHITLKQIRTSVEYQNLPKNLGKSKLNKSELCHLISQTTSLKKKKMETSNKRKTPDTPSVLMDGDRKLKLHHPINPKRTDDQDGSYLIPKALKGLYYIYSQGGGSPDYERAWILPDDYPISVHLYGSDGKQEKKATILSNKVYNTKPWKYARARIHGITAEEAKFNKPGPLGGNIWAYGRSVMINGGGSLGDHAPAELRVDHKTVASFTQFEDRWTSRFKSKSNIT
jgi:predicted transcriptional regulator